MMFAKSNILAFLSMFILLKQMFNLHYNEYSLDLDTKHQMRTNGFYVYDLMHVSRAQNFFFQNKNPKKSFTIFLC